MSEMVKRAGQAIADFYCMSGHLKEDEARAALLAALDPEDEACVLAFAQGYADNDGPGAGAECYIIEAKGALRALRRLLDAARYQGEQQP